MVVYSTSFLKTMAIIFEIFRIKIIYNFYDTAIYLFRREMTIFWPYTEVNIKIKCPVYISIVINTEVNAFFHVPLAYYQALTHRRWVLPTLAQKMAWRLFDAKPLCETGLAYPQLHNPKEHNLRKVPRDFNVSHAIGLSVPRKPQLYTSANSPVYLT